MNTQLKFLIKKNFKVIFYLYEISALHLNKDFPFSK